MSAFRDLVQRDVPAIDADLDGVPEDVRRAVGAIWLQRASSEAGAGSAFVYVRDSADRGVADGVVVRLAHSAVEDEARHAEICRRLACAYLNTDVSVSAQAPESFPAHVGASADLDLALQLVGMCCINESLACSFVETCMHHASPAFLHVLHREHLHDEVNHARVGFAHLASRAVSEKLKSEIAEWLPRVLHANVSNWMSRLKTLPENGIPGHAYPSRSVLVESTLATVDTLILPGFSHVGVDIRPVRDWRSKLAPT